ncbi:MAG: hypothetical protein ABFS10_13680 [Bacteroidota bacterium]
MNRKQIFSTFTLLLLIASVSAQIGYTPNKGSFTLNTTNMEPHAVDIIDGVATMRYSSSSATINGSPYLSEEFLPGLMTAVDGTEIPGLEYRYDIYGDKMEFILNQDTATINKPFALRAVEIGDRRFVYETYSIEANRMAAGYFEMIEEGGYLSMLFRREIEIEQDSYTPNYGSGVGTKEFNMKKVNNFYVKVGPSAAQKIKNKRGLLEILPDHQVEVKAYIKDHRLSIKKSDDMRAIAIYYNSLK